MKSLVRRRHRLLKLIFTAFEYIYLPTTCPRTYNNSTRQRVSLHIRDTLTVLLLLSLYTCTEEESFLYRYRYALAPVQCARIKKILYIIIFIRVCSRLRYHRMCVYYVCVCWQGAIYVDDAAAAIPGYESQ